MISGKVLVEIGGKKTVITIRHLYPPIPNRSNDYCAFYSDDPRDEPYCGYGATAEKAIADLLENYLPEDVNL